jgi:hypothetical protein
LAKLSLHKAELSPSAINKVATDARHWKQEFSTQINSLIQQFNILANCILMAPLKHLEINISSVIGSRS